jgi:hypothetical protein
LDAVLDLLILYSLLLPYLQPLASLGDAIFISTSTDAIYFYKGFPMASGEVREWTEFITPIDGVQTNSTRRARLYSDAYHETAVEEVEEWMASRGFGQRKHDKYEEMDAWFVKVGGWVSG